MRKRQRNLLAIIKDKGRCDYIACYSLGNRCPFFPLNIDCTAHQFKYDLALELLSKNHLEDIVEALL
jgi:hypothetical protein